ncbi:MAG: hypothetical protein V3V30_07710 [Parvularculaceae bacterium]
MMSMISEKFSAKTLRATIVALAMVLIPVGSIITAPDAMAQKDKEEKVVPLSTSVAKVVSEVFDAINAVPAGDDAGEDAAARAGLAKLNKLLANKPNMSPSDKSTVLEIRAGLKVRTDDLKGALRDFEEIVRLAALPESRLRYIRFVIAQLYFSEERYAEAAKLLEEYVRSTTEPVTAQTWYYLAASYYSLNQFSKAEDPAKKSIAASKKPNKSYYGLLNTIYNELGKEGPRGDLLVTMVNIWPSDKTLWGQLAGAYATAGRDRDAAVVLELAYKAGLIDDEDKIIALVQYYSLLENPYRGAKMLEREMAAGNVKKTKKVYELLGQMWNLAREQKKSIAAYEQVAKRDNTGKAAYNLGRVYFADEQWLNAERSLSSAIKKGGLSRKEIGDAWLLMGSARFSRAGDDPNIRQSALNAFEKASNYPASRADANRWKQYINEIKRVERAQDAVEKAQREEALKAEIANCKSIVQIFDRGGIVDAQRVADCRDIIAGKKKTGTQEAADKADAAEAAADATEEAPEEEAADQ